MSARPTTGRLEKHSVRRAAQDRIQRRPHRFRSRLSCPSRPPGSDRRGPFAAAAADRKAACADPAVVHDRGRRRRRPRRAERAGAAPRRCRPRPVGPSLCDEMGQGHAALGAAYRVLDLSVGRAARRAKRPTRGGFAVRQWFLSAGNGDFRDQARDPRLDAPERKTDRRFRRCKSLLCAGRERPGRGHHRFPPGWRRADPHPGARQGHVAGPDRGAGAAPDRDRDLPHHRHARPAFGAVAFKPGRQDGGPAGADHPGDARQREARQPGPARRPYRTCRRARGGSGRQPLPLRRQPCL